MNKQGFHVECLYLNRNPQHCTRKTRWPERVHGFRWI